MIKQPRIKYLILVGLLLGGCADDFTCGKYPTGGCRSVRSVDAQVNRGLHDYRDELYSDDNTTKTEDPDKSRINIGTTGRSFEYVNPGDPVLTKPTQLRILVTAFEDSDKDLDAGGYIFVRIGEGEWLIQ